MGSRTALAITGVCASLLIGCGRNDGRDAQQTADADTGRPAPTQVTGCLTEAHGRFVLTGLESAREGAPATATQMYRLTGDENQLRAHVGREVRVSGEAPPPQVAEIREDSTAPVGTSGAGDRPAANADQQVTTQTQARLEVSELRAISVTPTGDACSR